MIKCQNCSTILQDDVKFCSECGEGLSNNNSDSDKDLSINDLISWQKRIESDFDLTKDESEMNDEEIASKVIYETLDGILEKTLGDEKLKIDSLRNREKDLSKLENEVQAIIQIGKEVEKNLLNQWLHLSVLLSSENDNPYKETEHKLTDKLLSDTSLNNQDRIELAQQILNLISVVRVKLLPEVTAKSEIITSLIDSFDNKILHLKKLSNNEDLIDKSLISSSEQWSLLVRSLLPARYDAIKALNESLDADKIIPDNVIENNGDLSSKISSFELTSKMERYIKLINRSVDIENNNEKDRVPLAESLFGKRENYIPELKIEETNNRSDNPIISNKVKWGVVIILSIVALSGGVWTAIGVFILGVILINVVSI